MRLKRLAATVSATFDDALNKIENHEAVADCVIADARKAVGQIRVEKQRVAGEIKRLNKQHTDACEAVSSWRERALACAADDEDKALACLKRSEQSAQQAQHLQQQKTEHEGLLAQVDGTLQRAEEQLRQATLKRSALSARSAASRSRHKSEQLEANGQTTAVFERWEAAVISDELTTQTTAVDYDPLAQEFLEAEEAQRLKAELERLRSNPPE